MFILLKQVNKFCQERSALFATPIPDCTIPKKSALYYLPKQKDAISRGRILNYARRKKRHRENNILRRQKEKRHLRAAGFVPSAQQRQETSSPSEHKCLPLVF